MLFPFSTGNGEQLNMSCLATVAFKIEINLLEIIICIFNLEEEEVEEIEMYLESSARKNSARCGSKQKKSITSETMPVINTEPTESDMAEVNIPRFDS